ncbi:MAG: (Fe-S)-binding protein, partial [Armatimonadota bacterium]|nr:(Fe-S)-binding protein [Armatimonadota bacterium]
TCLVDQLFPQVGEAAVAVLRRAGVEVDVPLAQTCCGQVAFNDGFWPEAARLARKFLNDFGGAEAVVTPSASCATMVREFYPLLLRDDPPAAVRARDLAARTYELTEFLVDVLDAGDLGARFPHRVTCHASCHSLRGLRLRDQPLRLLRAVRGLELRELPGLEECCGFGGMFAVTFAALSGSMLHAKMAAVEASGAEVVTSTDCSCLMHIAGGLSRRGSAVRAVHIAEILAAR